MEFPLPPKQMTQRLLPGGSTDIGRGKRPLLLLVLAALTAQAAGSELEEVRVTAQKREQKAQDVGIAITVLSQERLVALGKTDSVQIAALTPGVTLSGSSGNQSAQFSIRGVTQNDFSDHVEAPNAVYLDEGYIGFSQGQLFGLFDLDRVEILKGPQGTLFGRNATGGLVNFVTRKPSQDVQGFADLTFGSFGQVRMEAALGGPVSDTVSGRLSIFHDRHDAILQNEFPAGLAPGQRGSRSGASDLWNGNQGGIRGQLAFRLGASTQLSVSAYASDTLISSANWQQVATTAVLSDTGVPYDARLASTDPLGCVALIGSTGACSGGRRPVVGGDYFGYLAPDPKSLRVSQDYARPDSNHYATQGLTAKLTATLGTSELTAVTHYMHFTKRQAQDVDESPAPQLVAMTNSHNDTFSQELRLSGEAVPLHWVAGVYYLSLWTLYNQALADEAGDGSGQLRIFGEPPGTPSLEGAFRANLRTQSYSAFGQGDLSLSDHWSLVTGLRLIQEQKDYRYTSGFYVNRNDSVVLNQGTPVGPFLPGYAARTSDVLWAGKLQLEYRPTPGLLGYAGIHRGVKAGSFNAPLSSVLTPEEYAYKPEVLTSVESGLKSSLLDGRVQLNGSAYYYHYQNYQAFVLRQVSGAISNVNARYRGLEFEANASPWDDLTLSVSGAYTDAVIPRYRLAPGIFRDVTPAFTPRTKFTGLMRYVLPGEVEGGRVAVQAHATRTSRYFQNLQNYQSMQTDASLIGNLRVTWSRAMPSGNWDLAVFIHNLSNVRNKTTGVDLSGLCGCAEQAYGDPRWMGVELRWGL